MSGRIDELSGICAESNIYFDELHRRLGIIKWSFDEIKPQLDELKPRLDELKSRLDELQRNLD